MAVQVRIADPLALDPSPETDRRPSVSLRQNFGGRYTGSPHAGLATGARDYTLG